MTTPPPDTKVQSETLEWIADSIARRGLPFPAFINSVEYMNALSFIRREVLSALRNERERCAKIAETHNDSHVNDGEYHNCGLTIAERIKSELIEPSCWHCGVLLTGVPKPRCEDCPTECDVINCDALGCADKLAEQHLDSWK